MSSTSRYENRMALIVWLCVEADTLRSLAIIDKYASTSSAPMSRGWRMPRGWVTTSSDENADSIQVGLFGLEAIVPVLNPLSHLIEQAGRVQCRTARFHGKFIPVCLSSIPTEKPTGSRGVPVLQERWICGRRIYRSGFSFYITLGLICKRCRQSNFCKKSRTSFGPCLVRQTSVRTLKSAFLGLAAPTRQ